MDESHLAAFHIWDINCLMKRLLQVSPGTSVRVIDFDGGDNLRSKLTQFGIYPGDCLRLLRVAPFGGPLLVMLGQALGSTNFASVLTIPQMVTYATFVMFYLPCLATLSVLRRELGTRAMLTISALTVVVAQIAAWIAWGAAALFFS